MEPEAQKERHGWVLLPGTLAAAAVLGVETAFATGTLGTQYNATIVWDDWDPAVVSLTTCEFEHSNQFIRRPISAVFSVCYVYVGFIMIIMTMIDLARSPTHRNLNVLMEREPWWGPTLAIGPLALGTTTFLGFASSREFLFPVQYWLWWCILGNFAAYAWCRLLQEGKGFKSCRRRIEDADEELMDIADSQGHVKSNKLKEVVLSLTSILCLAVAGGMDFLFYVLRRPILENQVQDLLIYLLLIVGIFPVYVHWKLRRKTIKVRWWRLSLAGAFGSGAFAILQGDYTLALCVSPTSSFQPYAGWEIVSALTILTVYFFFRGDRAQPQYIVIVQADHRQETGGVVSAFFVPEDDPYRSRKNKVALAVPAEAPTPANGQRNRSDSADSRSSARRTSNAQVESMARRVNGRASIQEMPVGAGGLDFGGSTRGNQGSRSPSVTAENDSMLSGAGAMMFASSQRVEGSTSSRTSQDSGGGSRRQNLKPRPVGALNRDGSVDIEVQRQRPRSLDRRPLNEDGEGSTRVSSYDRRVSVAEESRPHASSIERRLEPRPRPVERGPPGASLADTRSGSSISLTGRSSLVERSTQTRPQSLERGFLDGTANPRNSVSSARGSISLQQTGRPSSSSFDQYATAPIVAAVPITQVSSNRVSNSSTPGGEARPRPPSLTFDQSRNVTSSAASAETDIPVIVARSRGSNTYDSGRNMGSSSATTTTTTVSNTRPLPPTPPSFAKAAPRSSVTGNSSTSPPPPPSAPGGPTLASAAAPTSRPGSFVSQASTTGIVPPPGLGTSSKIKSATSSSSSSATPPNARPSVTFELPAVGSATSLEMERRPMATSFDSTGGGRRPPAASFDSTGGSRGRPSGVVPGRPRRSSVDRDDNAALRVLNTGMGRSVERERDLAGQSIDVRKIALRTPEEAREASRRLSVGTADDEPMSPPPPQANMSTAERLAALRAERARLEQAKEALQQRRAKQG